MHLLFFLPRVRGSLSRQLCGRYRKKLSVKINYSCIAIKQCDGPALVKLTIVRLSSGYLLRRSVTITLHIQTYCRFLFVTSVIICVQTSLTYQIKEEIQIYLNTIEYQIVFLKGK